jgi:anti-sigma B factor antagonist
VCYPYTLKPVQFNIEQRQITPGTLLIQLSGRLMLGPEGQQVERAVAEGLAKGDRRFVFDMSGITHIDSTGIGRCIASLNSITQGGGKLHMAGATGSVRESFRVTRLDRVFRFFDDVPAALGAFG